MELRDLRAKILPSTDQVLKAVAMATGRTESEIVREVMAAWAEKKVHEATLIRRLTQREGSEGSERE